MQPISAVFSEGRVVVPSENDSESLLQDGYGKRQINGLLVLESHEALYNLERNKISIIDETTGFLIDFKELLEKYIINDDDVWIRFIVYKDLRMRGFIIKERRNDRSFVVYERGTFRKTPPSYLVYIISEGKPKKIKDLIKSLECTYKQSLNLKLCVVDRRGEIVYYSLDKIKMIK